ncbi:hypothetical protein O0I10_000162 [Lichtheimia ornata]|uniref:Uncharacterized protein n=1 Tax=Lichtheimia ornata TaxID=688661 RepID=A0AAD8DJR6_9FUNG|nr:uncharacterized protein O0I10_000162 [Lichtheimia ornata]KAJ8663887.1 hypothetical protein O0I10_000162 [Lichtheimia ornata]
MSKSTLNDRVDTAKDDDELDGIDKMAYTFDEWCFAAMDGIGVLKSYYAATDLGSWTNEVYDGSNQECNDTIIPVASM